MRPPHPYYFMLKLDMTNFAGTICGDFVKVLFFTIYYGIMYLLKRKEKNMWCYYNDNATGVSEAYFFETKEEALTFVQLATQRMMVEYPNDPDMWNMVGEDDGILFEISTFKTAEEAVADWFGENN